VQLYEHAMTSAVAGQEVVYMAAASEKYRETAQENLFQFLQELHEGKVREEQKQQEFVDLHRVIDAEMRAGNDELVAYQSLVSNYMA
jgi:hypothetical protein